MGGDPAVVGQLDRRLHALFYEGVLDHARYEAWLRDTAVRFVALPAVELDPSAVRERALVVQRPDYLRELPGAPPRWRVFEVVPAPPAAAPPIAVTALRTQAVELTARAQGSAVVKVRPSPYWRLPGGCVEPAGAWTRVHVDRPGAYTLAIDFTPGRLVARGRRCG